MSSDTKNIASLTNNVTVSWTDEAGSYSESKPTFAQVQLIAYKATALISATNELIDDAMTDVEVWTLMAELIAEKIAEFEDTNVLNTSTKFTALLADTNVNVTTMVATKDSFADITYDNLIDVMRSVPTKYKKGNPIWIMHQDIVKFIEKMKDENGQPILYTGRSLKDAQIENTLLGYSVSKFHACPYLSSQTLAFELETGERYQTFDIPVDTNEDFLLFCASVVYTNDLIVAMC